MGDPAGVGPELCLRALASDEVAARCVPVVFGDAKVLQAAAAATKQPPPYQAITLAEWRRGNVRPSSPLVVDVGGITLTDFQPGNINVRTGADRKSVV